ncbi:MAG: ABC transporter ATP-binding protein [Gemmatimonadetes bacterium]|nr:ABC transporter ATP-binding protein [Gemmatimonadota bacterium]
MRRESAYTAIEPLVRLDGLGHAFGSVPALDDLSFDVLPGELFGVVGPDGAGKTTLLRILAGILRPMRGDAEVSGISVRRDPEGVKHRIAYMSQRFGLYTDLTVRENIEFYATLYQVPPAAREERIARLWEFSNLGQFQDRLAGKLSGGMKQKLSLCCALIHEPEVLLLDEPTFGVDPISRRQLWLIVHEMVARGMTAIVSTAYLDEAERCDRVAMLAGGRLAALDTPPALQARLAGRLLAFETAQSREGAELLQGNPLVRSAAAFGESLHVTLESAEAGPSLAMLLAASGVEVSSVAPLGASLEDVFIDLTSVAHAH